MNTLTALLVGDFQQPEFRHILRALSTAKTSSAADLAEALRHLSKEGPSPDVVVVACSWPGQYSHRELGLMRQRAPLARVLAVLGTWCEGETRTGNPWPGMLRAYWHEWIPRWSGDLRRFSNAQLPTWGLPHTATDDERALLLQPGRAETEALLLVCSPSYDMADMLCNALRGYGYKAVWRPDGHATRAAGVSAVIWDGNVSSSDQIAELRANFPAAPIVALVDFPRLDEVVHAESLGASAVMGKPFMLDDLFRELDRLLPSPARTATDAAQKRQRDVA